MRVRCQRDPVRHPTSAGIDAQQGVAIVAHRPDRTGAGCHANNPGVRRPLGPDRGGARVDAV